MVEALSVLLVLAGLFTVALGLIHLMIPILLDYRASVLSHAAEKLTRPFRLWPTAYVATPRDRYGIIWVMNLAASYGLITIGVADLFAQPWLRGAGHLVAAWIAGWWLVRAVAQFALGRRAGDWAFVAWFAALGALHLWVALTH